MIFTKHNTTKAHAELDRLFGLDKEVRIEIARKKRSNCQNSLMWLWLTCIEQETGTDKNELHIYFCKKFLPIIERKIFNEIIYDRTSTTTLDTLGFKHYLDKIQSFAATELAITLPDPEDLAFANFYETYKDLI